MRSKSLTAMLAVTGALATSGSGAYSPAAANHIYVTITGPAGAFKNDAGAAGPIEVLKFSYGIDIPPTAMTTRSGVSLTAGMHHYTPMHLTKPAGFASLLLLDAMIKAQPLSVTIDFVDATMAGVQPQVQTEIKLTNAYVIGIQQTSQPPGVNYDDIALIARGVSFTMAPPSSSTTGVVGAPTVVIDVNPIFVE